MLFFLAGLAFIGLAKAQSCPEPYGVQTYPNEQYCDKFYKVFKTYFTYFLTHANQSFDMYIVCTRTIFHTYCNKIKQLSTCFFPTLL